MVLPDVNLLVYSHNEASRFHADAKKWWIDLHSQAQPVALAWPLILGFVRIVTHPAIQTDPRSVTEAFDIVDSWLALPLIQWIQPGTKHYAILRTLLQAVGVGGNLCSDAHLAALAIEHQCELHSTDADFARFPGLKWVNPLT